MIDSPDLSSNDEAAWPHEGLGAPEATYGSDGKKKKLPKLRRLLVLPLLGLLSGCSFYERAADGVEDTFVWLTLDHEYRRAMRDFDKERYELAATELEGLTDRMPGTRRHQKIVYRQGFSYLQMKNYHDADETFTEYLALYPEGRFAADASQNQVRIALDRTAPNPAAAEQLERAKRDLAALQELEEEHPSDPEVKYRIGNIYYELELYKLAGDKYYEAQRIEAVYKEKELIKQRLYINEEGLPGVLTPAESRRLEVQRHPLVVFDVFDYYARSVSDFAGELVYKNITGKVRNQGDRTLRSVVVEVRFLNALNHVLDIQFVSLGRVGPGEVRAFLARASSYDNLYNITHVETLARAE